MRAWVLYEAGAPDRLTLTELPTPEPTPCPPVPDP